MIFSDIVTIGGPFHGHQFRVPSIINHITLQTIVEPASPSVTEIAESIFHSGVAYRYSRVPNTHQGTREIFAYTPPSGFLEPQNSS